MSLYKLNSFCIAVAWGIWISIICRMSTAFGASVGHVTLIFIMSCIIVLIKCCLWSRAVPSAGSLRGNIEKFYRYMLKSITIRSASLLLRRWVSSSSITPVSPLLSATRGFLVVILESYTFIRLMYIPMYYVLWCCGAALSGLMLLCTRTPLF